MAWPSSSLPVEGRFGPGPDAAGQPGLRFRRVLHRLRQEGGGAAQPPGARETGAGTPTSPVPAPSSGAGVRQPPGPGAQVEHHPGSRTDLHRPLPAHRCRYACTPSRKFTTRATWWNAWSGCAVKGRPTSITATYRLPGAQTRGLRPLPPDVAPCLPLGLRRPQEVWRTG